MQPQVSASREAGAPSRCPGHRRCLGHFLAQGCPVCPLPVGTTIPLRLASPFSRVHCVIIVPRSGSEEMAPAPAVVAGPRALVVDGQPLFLEALAGLLARPPLGASTRTAGSTERAMALLEEETADLVLCDLKVQPLPFRAFLAAVSGLPDAPRVILLSDGDDEESLVTAIDTGADG